MIVQVHQAIEIDYTNHKGVRSIRKIVPFGMEFTKNEWHTEEQWLIHAFDLDKHAERTFALNGIHSSKPHKVLRELTPEEYEAKVAAGKKITFAKGGAH